ncbi:aromatic alcohol reductase [Achromobacter xylosoxidans]|uniref:aromatic alcohol reductase n=1 Tax=Alcaligenes xylosoxydans xylosoxydans TaxID=85698 RepID=UPI0022B8A093|nr:aromatic alcohol reductase [Achromobacter xylosoxidans]MCZ8392050.1 aromatic alcohol reductase [Achromobacter xylosoxidans]
MSNPDATLVLGAGQLGLAMLRGLAPHAAAGDLAVLLRPSSLRTDDPRKQRDLATLRALGVQIVSGDLLAQPTAELAGLFGRYGTVVSCTGFVGGPGVQRKIARAALDGGVRRFVPWQFGVDYDLIGRGSPQDLFDEQLDVRDMLRAQSATEWLIVSTGMFTSFLFEPAFGVVDLAARRVNALGGWDTQVTVTTADDIGALTAAILRAEPRLANQVVYVAGDTVSYRQLADTVDRELGIETQRQAWTVPALMRELAAAPGDPMRKYRAVFAQGRGVAWDPARTFNAAHGIATQGLTAWVRENRQALRQAAGVVA